jgi:hypothetical protein
MKMKVLGTAVAAALLGLSTVSFGQGAAGSASGSSAASGQDTPREASRAQSGAGTGQGGASGAVTSGSGAVVTTPGVVTTSRCDAMTGEDKTRCLRDERASTGSSAGVPVTPRPGDSGPGALDKTNPGKQGQGGTAPHSRDAGTSSAGSPGGK